MSPRWQDCYDDTEAGLPSIADLTGTPGNPDEAVAEVRRALGIGARRERYGQDRPDTSALREQLGEEFA